jgi:pimeloyl-ACP methyl ester carboxylesterase
MPLETVNGVRLDIGHSGSGDPMILLHGSWEDRHCWALVEDRLAPDWHVVAYSRRGHSASEDSDQPGTRHDDEDDLAGLIEALDAPAHVVANSFGGCVALGLASRRSELFRSLAVHEPPLLSLAADHPMVQQVGEGVGPVLELIQQGKHEDAARFFVENIAIGPGAWDLMPQEQRAIATNNAPTFAGEMSDSDWPLIDLDVLSRLELPVLLTKGDQSPPFFAVIIDRLAETIPGAQVEMIPGAGHIPHETHPEEYVAAVGAFARDSAAAHRAEPG